MSGYNFVAVPIYIDGEIEELFNKEDKKEDH